MAKTRGPTIDELSAIDREYFTPGEIAPVLGCGQYAITVQAREDKQNGIDSFGFPVICIGNRVKIPKRPFLEAMGYRKEETA